MITKNLRHFKIKNVWIYLVLLMFIKPSLAEDIVTLDFIFNAGRIGLSILYTVLLIVSNKRTNIIWSALCGIFLTVFVMTVLNHGSYLKAITHYVPSIGLLSYFLYKKKEVPNICECLIRLGSFLLVMNIITYILFPEGLVYRDADMIYVWLLGQKQDLAGFIMPILFVACLMEWKTKKHKNLFLNLYALSIFTLFVEQSIAALICVVLIGCLCVFDKYYARKIKKRWLVTGCVTSFIIVQYIAYHFNDMLGFQNVLLMLNTRGINKVRSLNTRFAMWKFAWDTFFKNPLFGSGELDSQVWINGMGFYHSIVDNMYMDIIMTGGIVSIVLFIMILGKSFTFFEKYRDQRNVRYMGYILFGACLYIFTGSPFFPLMYLVFTAAAWLPNFGN